MFISLLSQLINNRYQVISNGKSISFTENKIVSFLEKMNRGVNKYIYLCLLFGFS